MTTLHPDPRFPFIRVVSLFDNLWALKELGSTNFLIKGSEKALLIDTAYGLTDYKALARDLVGDLPLLVVNSHAHPDHNAGNNQFREVMVGRGDLAEDSRPFSSEDKADLLSMLPTALKSCPAFDPDAYTPGLSEKVIPLDEGDVIDLGGLHLSVIETPGHTFGSIALYQEKDGWLFTGDTALTWPVWGQLPDSAPLHVYAESLERLASLAPQLKGVFPAHGLPESPSGEFMLPPHILRIYADGTHAILEGQASSELYHSDSIVVEGALVSTFEIGGMVYHPDNL